MYSNDDIKVLLQQPPSIFNAVFKPLMSCVKVIFIILLGVMLYYALFGNYQTPRLHPVIFIPGDGGSQVEAKLNKSETVHYICTKKTSDYFSLWLNLELLAPQVIDCFIDNFRLVYDNITRKTSNSPGVELRIPGFGHSLPVEALDPGYFKVGKYFIYIANLLVSLGYQRDLSLRGAPYDFRKAPNENQDYFDNLKALIEETYDLNGESKVVLLAHSMGSLMCLHFLQKQSQAWKNKFIQSLVTLSAPWGGSVKSIKVFAIGDDLGVLVLPKSTLKLMQITCPSTSWLLPSELFWKSNEVLVQTAEKNYTVVNLKEFFDDLGYPQGWEMRKDTAPFALDMRPPGVELHCLHGSHVSTPGKLVYAAGKFPDSPEYVFDNGDGTVNARSLAGCLSWDNKQGQSVYHQVFSNVDHMQILSEPGVLRYLEALLRVKNSSSWLW